jgi:cytochrome c biogenesis protein CcdA
MDESPSGWSFLKVVGVVLGLIGMVGFGVCTLCGVVLSFEYNDIWFLVLGGAVLTALSTWLVMSMFRKAREAREAREARQDNPSNTP